MSMENRSPFEAETSPFPSKRSSIENLKKASRVKNSSMFEREQKNQYDPAQPTLLERPLATGRPLSMQFQGNAFGGRGLQGTPSESTKSASIYDAVTQASPDPQKAVLPQISPSKNNISPTKSSLSKRTGLNARHMAFDPENGIWSDDDEERKLPEGRGLHRHAKSVTFDQAPPQINEYEMTTPDPSSVASGSREGSYDSLEEEDLSFQSFERGSSMDRDDSFDASLEDTDKTPVVLPEDWRFMSPENANTELAQHEEDVFDGEYGSPAPGAQPGSMEYRPHQTSVNSIDSNGQPRPLPPLPAMMQAQSPQSDKSISSTMERISNAQRNLPSPPAASAISKSEIRRMSGTSFSMEDRLQLMMLQEQQQEKSESEMQRERRMRRAGSKESSPTREDSNHSRNVDTSDPLAHGSNVHSEAEASPRITRQSILRRLQSEQDLYSEAADEDGPGPAVTSHRSQLPDPDVPIPSLEDPTQVVVQKVINEQVVIKEEPSDDVDLYSISDYYGRQHGTDSEHDDDNTSEYSQPSLAPPQRISFEEGQDTPRAQSPACEREKKQQQPERISLPAFMDFGESSSFDLGLESYLTPPAHADKPLQTVLHEIETDSLPQEKPLPDLASLRESIQRPLTPETQLQPPRFFSQGEDSAEPGTPDSVIRHPVANSPSPEFDLPEDTEPVPAVPVKEETTSGCPPIPERHYKRVSLIVPEPERPDETTEKITTTIESQRISSLVQLEIPRDQSDEALGFGLEKEFDRVVEDQKVAFELSLFRLNHPFAGRLPSSERPSHKDYATSHVSRPVLRDIPNLKPQGARALPGDQRARGHCYPTDGSHFANRSPGRQRGYLMRQNTKVVVASNREDEAKSTSAEADPSHTTDEVVPSPRKISQPTWTAEPWNGKSRRKSIRGVDKSPRKKAAEGPAPPLPGQVSNVQDGLGSVQEDEIAEEEAEDFEDGAERGRLFVKVVGLKELDLPLPRGLAKTTFEEMAITDFHLEEHTHFALTLDNGLHCVTTAWLDLGRSAPIGQEFELVVLNELEFQLTLQMKLEEPKVERPQSPTKAPASPTKKQGTFGRFFGSPKKKKELEVLKQQEAQARQSAIRPQTPPSAFELVQGLVAKDGSFARAYVALGEHEKQAFGRPYTVDIVCFNEWALEEVSVGSSRSKKGVTQLQRKPPYPIGKLELQMLYVPKPKGAKDEDMPKSMNGAVRELREAEAREAQLRANQNQAWEGHLSQQGGDCPVGFIPCLRTRTRLANIKVVLAETFLQACWLQAYCLSRIHAPTSCHYQPCQGSETY